MRRRDVLLPLASTLASRYAPNTPTTTNNHSPRPQGSALALKTWVWQLSHGKDEPLPSVASFTDGRGYYENEDQMLEQLRADLAEGIKKAGKTPTVLVMGALVCHLLFIIWFIC
jgi:hypothetical protein